MTLWCDEMACVVVC